MKLVVIINGSGGAGKDTVVDIVSKHYKVKNVSSVEPIKMILYLAGISLADQKTDKGRKLLSDVKLAFTNYNDMPFMYLRKSYNDFIRSYDHEIMFAHIREPAEIDKFKQFVETDVITLLIKNRAERHYGNMADDNVENYQYDVVFDNSGPLETLEKDFMSFFEENILKRFYGGGSN